MGTVRADNFSDGAGTGAPDFAQGAKFSGGFDTAGDAGVATDTSEGVSFKDKYLQFVDNTGWSNTSATGLGLVSTVPLGTYKVYVEANLGASTVGGPTVVPQLNGANISRSGTDMKLIANSLANATGSQVLSSLEWIVDFPNATNTFEIDVIATGANVTVNHAVYRLTKINDTDAGSDWD